MKAYVIYQTKTCNGQKTTRFYSSSDDINVAHKRFDALLQRAKKGNHTPYGCSPPYNYLSGGMGKCKGQWLLREGK